MPLKVTIACVGKPSAEYVGTVERYRRMSRPFGVVELVHVKASDEGGAGSAVALGREAQRLVAACGKGAAIVGMSEEGATMNSREFARFLERLSGGGRSVAFAVGGAYGLDTAFKRSCANVVSLSPMTMPHDLALTVLTEQVYRAFTILRGHPYHK